ncbi:hypothetical protein SRHO_G00085350 [Serrasalmus rhombeus]
MSLQGELRQLTRHGGRRKLFTKAVLMLPLFCWLAVELWVSRELSVMAGQELEEGPHRKLEEQSAGPAGGHCCLYHHGAVCLTGRVCVSSQSGTSGVCLLSRHRHTHSLPPSLRLHGSLLFHNDSLLQPHSITP